MGLDMYLHTNSPELIEDLYSSPEPDSMDEYYTKWGIAAYWRKANAIHKWFVDNVMDGVDECDVYSVSIEDLKRLLEVVDKVLSSSEIVEEDVEVHTFDGETRIIKEQRLADITTAEELLPTQSGFFFGTTDYDDWYLSSLLYTKDQITRILNALQENEDGIAIHPRRPNWIVRFTYEPSW